MTWPSPFPRLAIRLSAPPLALTLAFYLPGYEVVRVHRGFRPCPGSAATLLYVVSLLGLGASQPQGRVGGVGRVAWGFLGRRDWLVCRVVFPQMLAHYISPDVHSTPCRWAGLMAPLDTKQRRPRGVKGPLPTQKTHAGIRTSESRLRPCLLSPLGPLACPPSLWGSVGVWEAHGSPALGSDPGRVWDQLCDPGQVPTSPGC